MKIKGVIITFYFHFTLLTVHAYYFMLFTQLHYLFLLVLRSVEWHFPLAHHYFTPCNWLVELERLWLQQQKIPPLIKMQNCYGMIYFHPFKHYTDSGFFFSFFHLLKI